jgi:hypothetical protein
VSEIVRRGTLPDHWPAVLRGEVLLIGGFVDAKADKTRDPLVELQATARVGHRSIVAHITPLTGVCEVGRPRTDVTPASRSAGVVERPT